MVSGRPGSRCVCVSSSVVSETMGLCGLQPGPSVHGILQARILWWVAISFSRGSSQSRDQTWLSLVAQTVKNLSAVQETQVHSLGREDPLEKGMATHHSILAWRIPWTEEPGGLQAMGLKRVGHD